MPQVERSEMRKSYPAAFIAGLLGYLSGWWLESNWASYIMFFGLGYLGYDFRRVVTVTKSVAIKAIDEIRRPIPQSPSSTPYPWVSFLFGVLGAFYCVAAIGCEENLANLLHPFVCLKGAWTWVITNHNPLSTADWVSYNTQQAWVGSQGQFDRLGALLFFTVAAITVGFFLSYNLSALIMAGVKYRRQVTLRVVAFFRQHWIKMVMSPFWLIISCLIAPFVLVSRIFLGILLGIHTFRRLATAIATVGAGVVYLFLVPFNTSMPVAITAICCGLFCGAVASLVAVLIDNEKVKTWLKTNFLASPVRSFPSMDFGLARKSV